MNSKNTLFKKLCATLFFVLALFQLGESTAQAAISFSEGKKILNTSFTMTGTYLFGDINQDMKIDLIGFIGQDLYWFQNRIIDGEIWDQHLIAANNGDYNRYLGDAADIDWDGDLDVLVLSQYGVTQWYENRGGISPTWTIHDIGVIKEVSSGHINDLDNDGDFDFTFATRFYEYSTVNGQITYTSADKILWYENTFSSQFNWEKRSILFDGKSRVSNLFICDMDNDGDKDIYAKGVGTFFWMENQGKAYYWLRQNVSLENLSGEISQPGDYDKDGDMDLVYIDYSNYEIGFYKHDNYIPNYWMKQKVFNIPFINLILAVDIDLDQDLDWVLGSNNSIMVAENLHPNEKKWLNTIIQQPTNYAWFIKSADLDQDSDTDLIFSDWVTNTVSWYENKQIYLPKPTITFSPIPTDIPTSTPTVIPSPTPTEADTPTLTPSFTPQPTHTPTRTPTATPTAR